MPASSHGVPVLTCCAVSISPACRKNSSKDREQKSAGTYFIFDADEDAADKADAKSDNAKSKGGKKKG